jgi:hypothetical protein
MFKGTYTKQSLLPDLTAPPTALLGSQGGAPATSPPPPSNPSNLIGVRPMGTVRHHYLLPDAAVAPPPSHAHTALAPPGTTHVMLPRTWRRTPVPVEL